MARSRRFTANSSDRPDIGKKMAKSNFEQYRGQWGGRIESGEEMWWSEPWAKPIDRPGLARLLFSIDVRHHFLLRFWKRVVRETHGRPLQIADFGCGTGGVTLNFSRYIGRPITGIDIFETQLRIAREFNERSALGCHFALLGDGGRLPFKDGELDVLFSLDVLGHVPDVSGTLADWSRALKPGGSVILFTESSFSSGDSSVMAWLARAGRDMTTVVPEHISLLPREELERRFTEAGLESVERFSANVGHWFFFPKDYWTLLRDQPPADGSQRLLYFASRVWDRILKISPFYPWPPQLLRLVLTRFFGRSAHGTSYFYHLKKK
jgi:ubiquinone/menaquinone biosynthesis C-methylase UbiE